jgi:hypothetical protein
MHIYIYIVSFLYIMAGALIAFLYTLRGGKIYKAIPLGWGLCILGSFCAALIFPLMVDVLNGHYTRFFPEGNGIPLVVVFGWYHISIVVAVATILRKVIILFRPQSHFLGANPVRKKTRLYLYIGSFYLLLAVVMFISITIGSVSKWRNNRTYLLYKTDHNVLLEACRELSHQVSIGTLEPKLYQIDRGFGEPLEETKQFPRIITGLNPMFIYIYPNGIIDIVISIDIRNDVSYGKYGVIEFPENFERNKGNEGKYKKYSDPSWGIELIKGLKYYDEDFEKHPEHKKEVEELLKKNKQIQDDLRIISAS